MEQLTAIRTPTAQMSLRLQAAFGLRREASIKIVPAWADRGDTLVLKDSWNKRWAGTCGSHRYPGAAAASGRGQSTRQGQESGPHRVTPPTVDYLQHFRYECARVWHSCLSWASAFVLPKPATRN